MAIYVSKNGNIHFYKGDSGNITFKGLPTDKNYSVYLAISDPETNATVGDELVIISNYSNSVTFTLASDFTDKFSVDEDNLFSVYQYGLKICSGADEYTLIPKVEIVNENPIFKPAPKVIVHKKFVEGT